MSSTRLLLVHGIGGAPEDLHPLAEALADPRDVEAHHVSLPSIGDTRLAPDLYARPISEALAETADAGADAIVVAHSLGGLLALHALDETHRAGRSPRVRLLVLACTPFEIDGPYMVRWAGYGMPGRPRPTMADLGRVARLAKTARESIPGHDAPILFLYGARDHLVPASRHPSFPLAADAAPRRVVEIPGADHETALAARPFAADVISRMLDDLRRLELGEGDRPATNLAQMEPAVASFVERHPLARVHIGTSPGALRATSKARESKLPLGPRCANEPTVLNLEPTTACPNRCVRCARSLSKRDTSRHMPRAAFRQVLGLLPSAWKITLVGLGEPTAHPEIDGLVADAVEAGRNVTLVTSGALLDKGMSRDLIRAGLSRAIFSLDTADPQLARELRPGANLERVMAGFSSFAEAAREATRSGQVERPPQVAVFCAVGMTNAPGLIHVVESASRLGARALVLSDLNFSANLEDTLWKSGGEEERAMLRDAVRRAFELGMPVFGVTSFEEPALARRFRELLLTDPDRLMTRSERRRSCLSPWQVLPVAADGTVTACDCRPDAPAGSILSQSLDEIWNGPVMTELRAAMMSDHPPKGCRYCPRF